MGLSSKKSKTVSKETVAPTAYSQPYIDSAAQTLKPGYDKSMGVADQYQPRLEAAGDYYGRELGGQFLDGNPHLQGMIDSSNADITQAVNQQFMPRFGSGYHAKILAKQLGENENALRYGNYATERGYQDSAPRGLAGLATTATTLPMIPGSQYSGDIGQLLGRYIQGDSKSVTKTKDSLVSQLAQLAQMAAMAGGM